MMVVAIITVIYYYYYYYYYCDYPRYAAARGRGLDPAGQYGRFP